MSATVKNRSERDLEFRSKTEIAIVGPGGIVQLRPGVYKITVGGNTDVNPESTSTSMNKGAVICNFTGVPILVGWREGNHGGQRVLKLTECMELIPGVMYEISFGYREE